MQPELSSRTRDPQQATTLARDPRAACRATAALDAAHTEKRANVP